MPRAMASATPGGHAVEFGAIVDADAGDFHGDGGCGGGAELADGGGLRIGGAAAEGLGEVGLYEVGEFVTEVEERSLGAIPGDEAVVGFAGGGEVGVERRRERCRGCRWRRRVG